MAKVRLYLGKMDISEQGACYFQSYAEMRRYLISFCLIADEIRMQGSCHLKQGNVYKLFTEFMPLFRSHTDEEAMISFVLSSDSENFRDYINQRISVLASKEPGPEQQAYTTNSAFDKATDYDRQMESSSYLRRTGSVSKEQRILLKSFSDQLIKDHLCDFKDSQLNAMVEYLGNADIIQTYELIDRMSLRGQNCVSVHNELRRRYHLANAKASSAILADDYSSIRYTYPSVSEFLRTIGFDQVFLDGLDYKSVFILKSNEGFLYLLNVYRTMQIDDIDDLNSFLAGIRRCLSKCKWVCYGVFGLKVATIGIASYINDDKDNLYKIFSEIIAKSHDDLKEKIQSLNIYKLSNALLDVHKLKEQMLKNMRH